MLCTFRGWYMNTLRDGKQGEKRPGPMQESHRAGGLVCARVLPEYWQGGCALGFVPIAHWVAHGCAHLGARGALLSVWSLCPSVCFIIFCNCSCCCWTLSVWTFSAAAAPAAAGPFLLLLDPFCEDPFCCCWTLSVWTSFVRTLVAAGPFLSGLFLLLLEATDSPGGCDRSSRPRCGRPWAD